MTYVKGSTILAADYNGFLTTTSNVYGVGNADAGYGQTAISQSAVTATGVIRSTNWINLCDMVTVCANQQGTTITNLPPGGVLQVGDTVEAYEQASPSFNEYELGNYVTAINTNRLTPSNTSLSVATNVWTVTRATLWMTSITAEVSAIWGSENAARYYFNSGGQVRLHGAQPGSTPEDTNWNTFLTAGVNLVKFAAHATTNTGTISGSVALGYYGLTNSYQTIFTGTAGGSAYSYSGRMITISAKRLNYVGVNGGNGNGVQFEVVLTDVGTYTSAHVAAGTNFAFDNVKATTFLTGITSPTYTTVTNF